MDDLATGRKKDLLIFLSDQHDGRMMGNMGHFYVRTPNMDKLAEDGTQFSCAYTSCPLCVPARMSLLTGQLPCHTGVFTNHGSIHPETPTFLHSLALEGYETVLCGRMHFEGFDQRHGFTKRIAGDITATAIGGDEKQMQALAPGSTLFTDGGCLQAIGAGNSITLEYDRYVISEAVSYLSRQHDKPQCIVVGTYAPHYPYIAPVELYEHYLGTVTLPENLHSPVGSANLAKLHDDSEKVVLSARAAYFSLVEFTDQCLGKLRAAWDEYLKKSDRKGIFVYLSDHGDHAGERGLYGKQTLYEASVRIPLIFQGEGIPSSQRVNEPVSIMDFSPTLCSLCGAKPLPAADGISLAEVFEGGSLQSDRTVVTEWIDNPYRFGTHYGRAIRRGKWKLISYPDFPNEDLLTRPDEDIWETDNLIDNEAALAAGLRGLAFDGVNPSEIVRQKNIRTEQFLLIAEYEKRRGTQNTDCWEATPESLRLPETYVSTDKPLAQRFHRYWYIGENDIKAVKTTD